MSPTIMAAWPGAAPGMREIFLSDRAEQSIVVVLLPLTMPTWVCASAVQTR
jgi:hypothetical protein